MSSVQSTPLTSGQYPYVLWLGSIASLLVAYYVSLYFFHPLAKIPGPFFARFTRLWLVSKALRWKRNRVEIALHDKYGPIVRISPNEIMVSSPGHLKTIYGAGTHFRKAPWYQAPGVNDPEGLDFLTECNLDKYRLQRRLIGPVFTIQATKTHEKLMDVALCTFIKKMESAQSKPQDLVKWMNILAIDLLSEVTFGMSPNLIGLGHDDGNMADLHNFWKQTSVLGLLPEMLGFIFLRGNMIRKLVGADLKNANIFKWCLSQMMERTEDPKGSTDRSGLHGDLLRHAETHPELRPHWIIGMTLTIQGAGFDTISGALCAFLFYVVKTAGCQATLHEELDQAQKSGQLNDYPTYDQTVQLSYLQVSIREAQRLHTGVGISLPRVVPPEGTIMEGHHIPGGTVIGINPWVLHRNKQVFGEDADDFRPTRYTEATDLQRKAMDTTNLTFGGASRSCPGQHLAWIVLSKTCATIFLHFEVEVLNDEEAEGHGHGFREECTFSVKWEGIWIRLKSRL